MRVSPELAALDTIVVRLDDQELLVAVADTVETRRRGLMFVTDLGDLDGMLFVFEADTAGTFWMKDTLIPLEIAFFAASGAFVGSLAMEPCGSQDPCPTYGPGAPYRYALEAPVGSLAGLADGVVLELP